MGKNAGKKSDESGLKSVSLANLWGTGFSPRGYFSHIMNTAGGTLLMDTKVNPTPPARPIYS